MQRSPFGNYSRGLTIVSNHIVTRRYVAARCWAHRNDIHNFPFWKVLAERLHATSGLYQHIHLFMYHTLFSINKQLRVTFLVLRFNIHNQT